MKRPRWWQTSIFIIICAGVLLSTLLVRAESVEPMSPIQPRQRITSDVALQEGGSLSGAYLDSAGKPVATAPISVWSSGRQVAVAQTDAAGRFTVSGLRGGTYQILADQDHGLYRLWTPNTAPPSAQPSALLVRGQSGRTSGGVPEWFANPWVVTGIVAAAVAIPIAVHEIHEHRNRTPSSP